MPPKCSPHIAPSGVPCIFPPIPQGPEKPRIPVMTVNNRAPDKSGNVSLGALATKDTLGPDDLTIELKDQLKGDVGQVGPQGPQGPQGASLVVESKQETSESGGYNVITLSDGTTFRIRNGLDGEVPDISSFVTGVEYVPADKKVYLKHGNTRLPGYLDVTDFVKDGMIKQVDVVDDNLVITFNTDAGEDPVRIPLVKFMSFSQADPRQAGNAAPGTENMAARSDHVHPAETEVVEDTTKPRFANDAFPITVTIDGTDYTVSSNDDPLLRFDTYSDNSCMVSVNGLGTCEFRTDLSFNIAWDQAEGLKFNGRDPEPGVWPVLQYDVKSVNVRGVEVAMKRDLAEKADKPTTSTAGNLAEFDSNGNPIDAGCKAGDLARYSLTAKVVSNSAVTLDDRACNYINATTLPDLAITLPPFVTDKARAFIMILECSAETPTISYESFITLEGEDGVDLTPEEGVNVYFFTEVVPWRFVVTRKLVTKLVENTPATASQILRAMAERGIDSTAGNFADVMTTLGLTDTDTITNAVNVVMKG